VCGALDYLFFRPFAACCVTDTALPAIVTVALRPTPVFASAVSVDVPLALPDPVTVSHDGPVDDVQAQPLCVVTVSVAEPPEAEKLTVVGETV
jgi:hypothetical protein